MASKRNSETDALGDRINHLMDISGLELSGFADFTGVSESHLYAIINGTKSLTDSTAQKIAQPFNLLKDQLINPNYKLTKKLSKSQALIQFYTENKGVHKYFVTTKIDRKIAYYIECEVLKSKKFKRPFYVADVRDYCLKAGRDLSSKRVAQVLNYLVDKKILKKEKASYVLKNGELGKRMVDKFSKIKSI